MSETTRRDVLKALIVAPAVLPAFASSQSTSVLDANLDSVVEATAERVCRCPVVGYWTQWVEPAGRSGEVWRGVVKACEMLEGVTCRG